MPPERLNELLRQRALVQEHLVWLDREIAELSGQGPAKPNPVASPARSSTPTTPIESLGYEPDPVGAGADARHGCLVFFIAVLVLCGAAMVAIYFWKYRDRPVLFAPRPAAAIAPPHISAGWLC